MIDIFTLTRPQCMALLPWPPQDFGKFDDHMLRCAVHNQMVRHDLKLEGISHADVARVVNA